MKTKNKMIAMVEIAIVLCSVFLVALPAIAAQDQNQGMQKVTASAITTASEDDYVLDIYGNANEDDTIDMGDVVYTKLAIFGKKPKTELCDAKYDGRINVLDVIQTKLIILGKETQLTHIDAFGEVETVNKPVERIVSVWCTNNELLKVLDATDKIVGVDAGMTGKSTTLFPEISALPDCGGWYSPNFEAILSQYPDMYISWFITTDFDAESNYGTGRKSVLEEKLPGVSILCIDNNEIRTRTGDNYLFFIEELKRLGYILDRQEEAEEFTEFYKKCTDQVVEQTEGLTDDEKPSVWITSRVTEGRVRRSPRVSSIFDLTDLAGARNIAADLPSGVTVDLEWVIKQNPEYIFIKVWAIGNRKSPYAPDYSISAVEENMNAVLNCPELAHVDAVKNKRVYVMQYSHFSKGTSRCLCAAYLAKLFHPELFVDMDPQALHQEYVDRFLGIDVSVESGNFLYPPED